MDLSQKRYRTFILHLFVLCDSYYSPRIQLDLNLMSTGDKGQSTKVKGCFKKI